METITFESDELPYGAVGDGAADQDEPINLDEQSALQALGEENEGANAIEGSNKPGCMQVRCMPGPSITPDRQRESKRRKKDGNDPMDWHMRFESPLAADLRRKKLAELQNEQAMDQLLSKIEARRLMLIDEPNLTDGASVAQTPNITSLSQSAIHLLPPVENSRPWMPVGGPEPHSLTFYVTGEKSFLPGKECDDIIHERPFSSGNLCGRNFSELLADALKLNMQREMCASDNILSNANESQHATSEFLWVEKYRPRNFLDLLSDDGVNRCLMTWLKLWDCVVFGKKPVRNQNSTPAESKGKFVRRFFRQDIALNLDEHNVPEYRIALLCGPPGLGKTTLAHVAGKHAGYNVVEVNASDDRTLEKFSSRVDNALSASRTVDCRAPKPNLLVLDEVDGAPQVEAGKCTGGSVLHWSSLPKASQRARFKDNVCYVCGMEPACDGECGSFMTEVLECGYMPTRAGQTKMIICPDQSRCNLTGRKKVCCQSKKQFSDWQGPHLPAHLKEWQWAQVVKLAKNYAPALRDLRKMALLLTVPGTSESRLVQRLEQVCTVERVHTEMAVLRALCTKTELDIRSCINFLQFASAQCAKKESSDKGSRIEIAQVNSSALGSKDQHQSLFDVCRSILTMQNTDVKKRSHGGEILNKKSDSQNKLDAIYWTALSFGDADKLRNMIFENYPLVKQRQESADKTAYGASWLSFGDILSHTIMRNQLYQLGRYQPYVAVAAHVAFCATAANVPHRLAWPLGMNSQLYSSEEKQAVRRVVNAMLHFGLCYVQRRVEQQRQFSAAGDAGVAPVAQPVEELALFDTDGKSSRVTLGYSAKQMIARELQTERLRRENLQTSHPHATVASVKPPQIQKAPKIDSAVQEKCIKLKSTATHALGTLPFKSIGRSICRTSKSSQSDSTAKNRDAKGLYSTVPVRYKFTAGYSNAVRRYIQMRDLL